MPIIGIIVGIIIGMPIGMLIGICMGMLICVGICDIGIAAIMFFISFVVEGAATPHE